MWLSIRQSLTWRDTTHVSGCSLLSTAQCSINAIIQNRLVDTLHTIGQHPSICNWILDLLISCSQNVRLGKLSPLLYALFTYGCKPIHDSNTIARFADNVGAHIRRWPRRLSWILGLSRSHTHVHINTEAVERAPSVRFHHYRWPQYLSFYYLRRLIRVNLTQNPLVSFYRCTTENILTNRTAAGTKASKDGLQHGVKTAQDTGGTELPSG